MIEVRKGAKAREVLVRGRVVFASERVAEAEYVAEIIRQAEAPTFTYRLIN